MSREPPPRIFHIAKPIGLQERIRAAYDGVKTSSQIAREIGTTTGHVSKAIFRLKLKDAPLQRKSHLARRAEYIACVDAGMTIYECAAKLGVSHHTVRSMAQDHGWEFKAKRRAKKPRPAKPTAVKISASPDAIRRYLERAK